MESSLRAGLTLLLPDWVAWDFLGGGDPDFVERRFHNSIRAIDFESRDGEVAAIVAGQQDHVIGLNLHAPASFIICTRADFRHDDARGVDCGILRNGDVERDDFNRAIADAPRRNGAIQVSKSTSPMC